jgi:acyl-CoA thioester hydrolase
METYRAVVRDEQCDMMGHLTTHQYGTFFGPASWGFLELLGYDIHKNLHLRIGMVEARHTTQFIHELLTGDEAYVESSVARLGTKSITTRHRLIRTEGNILCAEFESVSVMFDLDKRCAIPLVEDLQAGASAFIATEAV